MKVFRVVINDGSVECGVVFDISKDGLNETGRSGRAILTLPSEVCESVVAAAQVELDKLLADPDAVSDPEANITTELHRLRHMRQSREKLRADIDAAKAEIESVHLEAVKARRAKASKEQADG